MCVRLWFGCGLVVPACSLCPRNPRAPAPGPRPCGCAAPWRVAWPGARCTVKKIKSLVPCCAPRCALASACAVGVPAPIGPGSLLLW